MIEQAWHERKPGPEMAKGILDHVLHLQNMDKGTDEASIIGRRERLVNQRAMFLDRMGLETSGAEGEPNKRRSAYPVIGGATCSVHAKITTSRPRPEVIAVGGRWKQHRRAKLLQRWLDGYYECNRIYKKLADLAQDGMIYDAAWLKVYGAYGKVTVERVWDGDILIDPREERFPPVRTLYHVQAVDRGALLARYPEKRADIKAAPRADMQGVMPFLDLVVPSAAASFLDFITVIEAWRLGPCEEMPGKHVAAIGGVAGGCVIYHEDYDYEDFPFVKFVWNRDPERTRGQSFVEIGAGVQCDLDDHSDVIRESRGRFVPRWAVPSSANVRRADLGDEVGTVMVFDGPQPPTVLTPPHASAEFLGEAEGLKQRIYHVTGASELEATSMVQPNLSSGRAILAHQDATSIRFLEQSRNYEQASVDLAKLIIRTADALAESEKASLKVYGVDIGAEIIDYRDVKMARDEYTIRVYPASKLPDTPAGRQEIIGQMMDRQIITDPLEARRLMDMPDLERNADLNSARREYADRMIDKCLDGEQGIPTNEMDVPYALNQAQIVLVDALSRGGDEDDPEAMEMLRTFIGAAKRQLKAQEAKAAAEAQAAMPAQPMPANDGGQMPAA